MSRVVIPGAKGVRDALSGMSKVDGGYEKCAKPEKKGKKDYGISDRVLRPRVGGNKILKGPK